MCQKSGQAFDTQISVKLTYYFSVWAPAYSVLTSMSNQWYVVPLLGG